MNIAALIFGFWCLAAVARSVIGASSWHFYEGTIVLAIGFIIAQAMREIRDHQDHGIPA
jgi:hypothetical protein